MNEQVTEARRRRQPSRRFPDPLEDSWSLERAIEFAEKTGAEARAKQEQKAALELAELEKDMQAMADAERDGTAPVSSAPPGEEVSSSISAALAAGDVMPNDVAAADNESVAAGADASSDGGQGGADNV